MAVNCHFFCPFKALNSLEKSHEVACPICPKKLPLPWDRADLNITVN